VADAGAGCGDAVADDITGRFADVSGASDFDAGVLKLAPCGSAVGSAGAVADDRGVGSCGIVGAGGGGNGTAVAVTGTFSCGAPAFGEFVARKLVAFDLPVSFGEAVVGAVSTEAACSFAGVVASCAAHMAAKLPAFLVTEGKRPSRPEAATGAAPVVIASWNKEFTVKSQRPS
jgi:hypothetical protein